MFRGDFLFFLAGDFDGMGVNERPNPVEYIDLILFHQVFHPVAGLFDHVRLPLDHLFEVGLGLVYLDSVFAKVFLGIVEMLGRVQHGLRRNTSYIETCPAQGVVFLNKGCFKPQLGTPYSGHVAAGTRTNNRYVVLHNVVLSSKK